MFHAQLLPRKKTAGVGFRFGFDWVFRVGWFSFVKLFGLVLVWTGEPFNWVRVDDCETVVGLVSGGLVVNCGNRKRKGKNTNSNTKN